MTKLLGKLNVLKAWQWLTLVAVFAGAAGGVYVVHSTINAADGGGLGENQSLVPVTRDDLITSIWVNGSVVFPSKESLSFDTPGVLGNLMVVEGQAVAAGQQLAALDRASIASLERAAAKARLDVATAEEALDTLTAAPPQSDMDALQLDITSAQVGLDNAHRSLSLAEKEWQDKIADAEDATELAVKAYAGLFYKWLGIDNLPAYSDPDATLTLLGVDLDALFHPSLRHADINRGASAGGLPRDDPDTPWSEPTVYAWNNFSLYEFQPSCDDAPGRDTVVCIHWELSESWNELEASRDSLSAVETQAATALSNAENTVAKAEDALRAADLAREDSAQDPDPLQVALKEADLAIAELDLEAALNALEGAALASPLGGVVSEINVEPGQDVSRSTTIMTVLDPTVVEVDGVVDEIDVLSIRVGATANVIMDALPGQEMLGAVSYIAPTPSNQQGIVTYAVRIQVALPPGTAVREGLTAIAQLVVNSEPNVLLAPIQAIRGSFDRPTVLVSQDGVLVERPVTTGSSDEFWVVVSEGLAEGELVVMESVGGFDFGPFGFGPGGGFGGGRGSGAVLREG